MFTVLKGAEMPNTPTIVARRVAAAALAGGMSLVLAGCGGSDSPGSSLRSCEVGWEAPTSLTNDPSTANTAMQEAIAKLIDEVAKSGAHKSGNGYQVASIPPNLVGAANGVLTHFPDDLYVGRTSALQQYGNEVCLDGFTGLTYLTPAFQGAVGSLASAGIVVDATVARTRPTQQP